MPRPDDKHFELAAAKHGAEIAERRSRGESFDVIAHAVGLGRWTVRRICLEALNTEVQPSEPVIGLHGGESDDEIAALIARRVDAFRRKAKKREARTTRIRRTEPWAVCHMGDPHVDDDGCDWPALQDTIRVIQETDGMYAGNVGDTINNWVGRLQALYKNQSSTEGEAFQLAGWLLRAVPWDYVVLGNHDHWNQGGALIRLLARDAKIHALVDHEAAIEYVGDDDHVVTRLTVRHDFKGKSMWNEVHGGLRRAKMRPWADVLVSGHHHDHGVHIEEVNGIVATVLKVRGFKRFDSFAEAHDFEEKTFGTSITTVHDPDAHPADAVKAFYDVAEAAEYLRWIRGRRG